jgi:hypothetical protein
LRWAVAVADHMCIHAVVTAAHVYRSPTLFTAERKRSRDLQIPAATMGKPRVRANEYMSLDFTNRPM